mmetsp:Transcript_15306/g.29163  ORF Transcript_15306/g.29163 Transcript_15306/m.29163 type:complete len:257 (-) Transcript_15306:140-910(-)
MRRGRGASNRLAEASLTAWQQMRKTGRAAADAAAMFLLGPGPSAYHPTAKSGKIKPRIAPIRSHILYADELVRTTPSGFDTRLGTCPLGGRDGIAIRVPPFLPSNPTSSGELLYKPSMMRYPVNATTTKASDGRTSREQSSANATTAGLLSMGASQKASLTLRLTLAATSACSAPAAPRRTRDTAARTTRRFRRLFPPSGAGGAPSDGNGEVSSSANACGVDKTSRAAGGTVPPGKESSKRIGDSFVGGQTSAPLP